MAHATGPGRDAVILRPGDLLFERYELVSRERRTAGIEV